MSFAIHSLNRMAREPELIANEQRAMMEWCAGEIILTRLAVHSSVSQDRKKVTDI
jgi:hypothetical protein